MTSSNKLQKPAKNVMANDAMTNDPMSGAEIIEFLTSPTVQSLASVFGIGSPAIQLAFNMFRRTKDGAESQSLNFIHKDNKMTAVRIKDPLTGTIKECSIPTSEAEELFKLCEARSQLY